MLIDPSGGASDNPTLCGARPDLQMDSQRNLSQGGEQPSSSRGLSDIDFVASAFDCIPETLAEDFLFRHMHPFDPPSKTILQLMDAETALRIDLFRACGKTMRRTAPLDFPSGPVQLISQNDIQTRAVTILLDLRDGIPVSAKHANDYPRLQKFLPPSGIETA